MTGYYDLPNTRFTCSNCQWSGLGHRLAQGEVFQELVEYDCPRCGEKVTVASFPTREETAAAAQAGNDGAARELARSDDRERRWERMLETRSSAVLDPPELAGREIECELRLEDAAGETWLVLSANGCELHRELAAFESTEPAHRLLAVMRERYGERLKSFNYEPALLYLAGDRLGAVRELDGLMSKLQADSEEAGTYYVIQDAGDPAPWALIAVRPRGLYEMWTGIEWVDMPFFAAYFSGGEIGARQIEPSQLEAIMATIKPPPPGAVAMLRADASRVAPDEETPDTLDPDAIKAELTQRLSELQPRRTWASVVADAEIWQRTEDTWDLLDPPEDHALPPDLPWTEVIRQLALSQYRAIFDKFREPGEHYDFSWPPEGFLTSAGSWHVSEAESCSEHGDDNEDGCDACQSFERAGQVVIDEDATWEWSVDVETWGPAERSDGSTSIELLEADRWTIGYTDVNPLEVEYGPHRNSPHRAEMAERFWRGGGMGHR